MFGSAHTTNRPMTIGTIARLAFTTTTASGGQPSKPLKPAIEASIRTALDELVANEWAWVDDDHEEVLVRRHTAPAGHKKIQGALQATFEVSSPRLRQIAVAMLSAPDFIIGSPT